MSAADKTSCGRTCWLMAVAGGVVVWLLLMLALSVPALKALVIAVILAVVGALVLRAVLCGGADAPRQAEAAVSPGAEVPVAPAPPVAPAQATPAPEAQPVTLAAVTPRPDPSILAPTVVPGMADAPAKPARKPRAAAVKARTPAKVKAAPAPKAARATGLDAAMGRSKEPAAEETELLLRPRGGKGDDLKLIVGVGPKLEKLLNEIGIWHFDQIAGWKARDIALVDSRMENFKGRITRDGWVKQARALAKGDGRGGKA